MFDIGPSLREARTRRGLTPEDVHKGIRIRERYLTALEEERWDQLPGEAYVKGFLRTYAEFLGLDGNLYIDEYNSRVAEREEEPPFVPASLAPTARADSRGTIRLGVAVGSILAIVIAVAAWQRGGGSPPSAKAPPLQPGAALAAAPRSLPRAKAPAAPRPAVAIVRAVRGTSWVSIRVGGAGGRILYEGLLAQGSTLRYPVKQTLWVRMGRPWLLDVNVAGRTVGSLPTWPESLLLTRAGAQAA